ncbi:MULTISPECIES: XRE family transcriptional regulator [Streptomyces]|uniref:helix-turn-helix domain-containing protein n=1 Tax=Streptomyces TaxID=1883 RepID=UPI001FED177D|nr:MULTISPECIES: XRE family transcriptional regulator [Streptomyces]
MITDTECGQLAAELRRLRERTGLSLAALARRTPYSKSSWERYLNGKQPPPRKAVEALCAVAHEPPARLLALWELADSAWSGRSRPAGPAPAAPGDTAPAEAAPAPAAGPSAPPARRWRPAAAAAGAVCAAALAAGAALLALRGPEPERASAGPEEKPIRNPGCAAQSCVGQDPTRMGCGGAGMVDTVHAADAAGGRHLELRHGGMCQAVWVRASGLAAGDRVELSLPDFAQPQVLVMAERDVGNYVSTPMAPAAEGPAGARMCVLPAGAPEDARVCFP